MQSLLGGDRSYQPALHMFERLKGVLAARCVLPAATKKTLKIFTPVAYTLPPQARAAAEAAGTDHVRDLLARASATARSCGAR